MISVDFEGSHFKFQVNQESSGFFSVVIGFLIHKNMGLDTKTLSLYILETELSAFLIRRPTGSSSQFGDRGIHILCSDKSQEQNKIGIIMFLWLRGGPCVEERGARGVYRAHRLV